MMYTFTTKKNQVINLELVGLVTISTMNKDGRSIDRAVVVENGKDVELWGAEVSEFQKVNSEYQYNWSK